MVTKEQILAIELETETVEVPDLGVVTLRELSMDEYADWVAQWASQEQGEIKVNNRLYRAALLQRTVLNGDGGLMFTPDDLPRLARLPARVTHPLIQVAERLNRISATAMRDAKKNSDGGQDG